MNDEFYEQLHTELKRRKLTQKAFSVKLGYNRNLINNSKSVNSISRKALETISDYLQMPLVYMNGKWHLVKKGEKSENVR